MSENGRRPCYSNAEIFKAVRARWKIDLILPYIASIPMDSWLKWVNVRKNTYPGVLSKLLFGGTRARAARFTIPLSKRI